MDYKELCESYLAKNENVWIRFLTKLRKWGRVRSKRIRASAVVDFWCDRKAYVLDKGEHSQQITTAELRAPISKKIHTNHNYNYKYSESTDLRRTPA